MRCFNNLVGKLIPLVTLSVILMASSPLAYAIEPQSLFDRIRSDMLCALFAILVMAVVIIALVVNIVVRKKMEKALMESQTELSYALDMARLGYWEYDAATNLFTFSDHFYNIYRTSAEKEGGHTMPPDEYARRFVHPDDTHMVGTEVKNAVTNTDSRYNRYMEHRIRFADGDEGYVAVRFFIVKDDQGNTAKVFGINQDITERKQIESRLRQSHKLEAIGTLAGGIAHDFNNIIQPMVGFCELLQEDLPADSPLQNHVDGILNAAIRARELVKQILTFSHLNDQKIKPIMLQPVITEAMKLLRSSIPKTIDMVKDIDPDCGVVLANPTHVYQIVMNLCTNAYHAMENTGGRLTLSLKQVHLETDDPVFREMASGDYALLSVSDTGAGIPRALLDKIFDPYFTTKEKSKGTGLGLSIVQGIVKQRGGDIRIYSELGKGTEVHVYLPIVHEKDTEKTITKRTEERGGTEKILLVDDEEQVAQTIHQMLERLGYQVTTCIGSLEALDTFNDNPEVFDLVITDLTMPDMTGIELAGEIKSLRKDIPIILCTGFSDQHPSEKIKALGIQGRLMKPVTTGDLAKTIRNILKQKPTSQST